MTKTSQDVSERTTLFDLTPIDLKAKVKEILIKIPETRDNDALLLTIIWRSEIKERYGHTNVNVGTFLNDFSVNYFAHSESIRRYRQMVQQADPTLAGRRRTDRKLDGFEIKKRVVNNEL